MGILARLVAEERSMLELALRAHWGCVSDAAAALGVSRRTMQVRMRRHELRELASELRTDARIPGGRSPTPA